MALVASDVITSARGTLIDAAKVAWSDADLIGYLNEALRATVSAKPDIYPLRENIELEPGSLQQLPANGISLIDIFENSYSGLPITLVDKELLDESNRFLTQADRERDVQHFTADPRDPRRFVVTPPNDGTGEVRAVFGAAHPALTTLADDLLVDDIYQPLLIDYVLHRAYAKNSKRQDLTKSGYHKQQWAAAVGLNSRAQAAIAPKVVVSEGKQ